MAERKEIDELPRRRAERRRVGSPTLHCDQRFAWPCRAGNAMKRHRGVVEQEEIRTCLADRKLLGKVAVRGEATHAELADTFRIVDASGL